MEPIGPRRAPVSRPGDEGVRTPLPRVEDCQYNKITDGNGFWNGQGHGAENAHVAGRPGLRMADLPDGLADRLTAEPLTAHLATCRDGRPHAAPVWYLYADGTVEIVTAGRKLADVRANPYVSLSIEQSTRGRPEWTATLRGTAEVIEDPDAFAETNRRINRKYGAEDDAWEENTLVRIGVGSASLRTY